MQKIHTEIIYQFNKSTQQHELISDIYYWYNGDIAHLKGGGESAPTQTTTVQKTDPWEGQKQYLTRGFTEAEKLLDAPTPEYFPGSAVVPFSPETEAALNMQTNRALNGSPIQAAATDQLSSTLRGDYLTGGAGFNSAVDSATRKILPQVNSAFERAGRTGSGLAATAQTQAISDSFADQYQQERQNQLKSMLFAPQIASQDYEDISKLSEVGSLREGISSEQLAEDVARYNYDQNSRRGQVADFINMIQGNYGGSTFAQSTVPQPSTSRNRLSSALGGALSGAAGGAMAGGGPGAAVGGVLGLLGGFM